MIEQALLAYFHYAAVFATVAALVAEYFIYRPPIPAKVATLLPKIDLVYGAGSVLAVGTGFARAFWFEKTWDFYRHSSLFWLKVALVALWGLLSIVPTLHFLKIARLPLAGGVVSIEPTLSARIRKLIVAQMAIVPWVPLVAVLMSRGLR
jgi:putative membrane protein